MAAAAGLTLLTGAAGFVGRQVLRELVERNCRVRSSSGRAGRTDAARRRSRRSSRHRISGLKTPPGGPMPAAASTRSSTWPGTPSRASIFNRRKHLDCLAGTLRLGARGGTGEESGALSVSAPASNTILMRPIEHRNPAQAVDALCGGKADAFTRSRQSLPPGVEFAWCRLFYLYGEGEAGAGWCPICAAGCGGRAREIVAAATRSATSSMSARPPA